MKTFNEDIKFIRDDSERERSVRINEILDIIDKDPEKERRLLIGNRFLYALMLSARQLKLKKEVKKVEVEKPKPAIEIKKKPVEVEEVSEEIPRPELEMPIFEKEDMSEVPIRESPLKADSVSKGHVIPEAPIKEIPSEAESMSRDYVILKKDDKDIVTVSLKYEDKLKKLDYVLNEPKVNEEIIEKTMNEVTGFLKNTNKLLNDDTFLVKKIKGLCKKFRVEYTDEYLEYIKYYLNRDLVNFGKIDSLMHDDNVNGIICEGVHKKIKVDYNGEELETNIIFDDEKELDKLIHKFAEKLDLKLDKKNAHVEGSIDNFQVKANLGFGNTSSSFTLTKV